MATWNLTDTTHHLFICNGGCCMRKQGEEVTQAIRDEIAREGLDPLIHTTRTRCNGRCDDACVVIQYPQGIWYRAMTPEAGRQLVRDIAAGHARPVPGRITYTYRKDFNRKSIRFRELIKPLQ